MRHYLRSLTSPVPVYLAVLFCALSLNGAAQTVARRPAIAVLNFGDTRTAKEVVAQIAKAFERNREEFRVINPDQANAAAEGIGYKGSLNMTLGDARDLGSAVGCDFFFTSEAQTLRRYPSSGPIYFESYASIFLVSARTGRLILWEQPVFQAPSAEEARKNLLDSLAKTSGYSWVIAIRRALEDEREERARAVENLAPVIAEAPNESDATISGLQLPRPYRRLKPPYTNEAAHAEVEAVVDVLVDIDASGEVSRVEVVRWAGYGLDQSVIETVRQLHFVPAKRDGTAIPMRVLMRYNFRKPPRNSLP